MGGVGSLLEKDSTGRAIQKTAIANKGATYCAFGFKFWTAKNTGGIDCKKYQYHVNTKHEIVNDLSHFTYTMVDSSGVITTTDANAVMTIIDIEIQNEDIEIIAARMKEADTVAGAFDVYCIGVPDIAPAGGGFKEMCRGIPLDTWKEVETNGRASKFMAYSATNHTSKLRIVIDHPQGTSKKFSCFLDVYRA